MTDRKVVEVLDKYDRMLSEMKIRVKVHDPESICISRESGLEHIRSMIPKMKTFIEEGRRDKVFRWLGWIGCKGHCGVLV